MLWFVKLTAGPREHESRTYPDLPRAAAGVEGGVSGVGARGEKNEEEEEEMGKRLHTVGVEAETLLRSRFDEN